MDNTKLSPQVPGQTPGVDPESLQPLLELPLVDLAAGLSVLTNDEVDLLVDTERRGENRDAYIEVLTTEQMRRIEDDEQPAVAPPVVAENAPAPLGDAVSYASMRAADVDPCGLERSVLTKDGWVLPQPKLSPQ